MEPFLDTRFLSSLGYECGKLGEYLTNLSNNLDSLIPSFKPKWDILLDRLFKIGHFLTRGPKLEETVMALTPPQAMNLVHSLDSLYLMTEMISDFSDVNYLLQSNLSKVREEEDLDYFDIHVKSEMYWEGSERSVGCDMSSKTLLSYLQDIEDHIGTIWFILSTQSTTPDYFKEAQEGISWKDL